MTEAAAQAKPKRKKSKSPTARTLELCRKRGWLAAVVERRLPHCFITQDLFGFADIVVLDGRRGLLAIQATSGSNGASRVEKLNGVDAVRAWLLAGLRVEVWAWRQVGAKGARKLWDVRRLKAELVDGAIAWDEVADA